MNINPNAANGKREYNYYVHLYMVCALLIFAIHTGETQSLQYPANFSFIQVLNPLAEQNPPYRLKSASVPAIGASFFDPDFGTVLTRVTKTDGINSRHEYSRFDPFNVDQSMIILVNSRGYWNIYRTQSMPYNQDSNRVRTIDLAEPRWDRNQPNLIWGLEPFAVVQVDAISGVKSVIKDFTQDPILGPIIAKAPVYRITTKEEGEASMDFRYWGLMLQSDDRGDYLPYGLFTWDRINDKVLGVHILADNNKSWIDWVGMTPLGTYMIIAGDANEGSMGGLMIADKELTQFHRLAYVSAHSDVGLDTEGKEAIVMQNPVTDYVDYIPCDWNIKPIEQNRNYQGTGIIPLIRLFYSSASSNAFRGGIHISCNTPEYAIISTTIEPGVADQNWLDRSLILVKLNENQPRVFYLAKLHNTTQTYWEETQATITNDGKKIVWADNWGENVGKEQMFLMQLDMPPNWRKVLTPVLDWKLWDFKP